MYPEAISIGMPSEEFWDGKPSRFWSYVEAYKLRLEREEQMQASLIDYQSWLTGLYVHNALQVALANSFSKGRKSKYVAEPISFTERKKRSSDERKRRERELENQFLAFKQLTDAMNGGLKKR